VRRNIAHEAPHIRVVHRVFDEHVNHYISGFTSDSDREILTEKRKHPQKEERHTDSDYGKGRGNGRAGEILLGSPHDVKREGTLRDTLDALPFGPDFRKPDGGPIATLTHASIALLAVFKEGRQNLLKSRALSAAFLTFTIKIKKTLGCISSSRGFAAFS
jgi:hypothetical protein